MEGSARRRTGDWSDDETEKLFRLHDEQGLTFPAIAREIGRTPQACRTKYKREMSERRPAQDWTAEHIAVLLEGFKEGHTYAQIASKLGRSEKSIEHKIHDLRLKRRRVQQEVPAEEQAQNEEEPTVVSDEQSEPPATEVVLPPATQALHHPDQLMTVFGNLLLLQLFGMIAYYKQ
jgi:hypothetical protein